MKQCNIMKTFLCFLKVMLFQVVRSPAIAENFSLVLDPSLYNVTVYVTGDSPVFIIYSPTGEPQKKFCRYDCFILYNIKNKMPKSLLKWAELCFPCLSGVSQSGSVVDGPLGSILTVGNLKRVKLNSDNHAGEWKISINSTRFYNLKVTGTGF